MHKCMYMLLSYWNSYLDYGPKIREWRKSIKVRVAAIWIAV